MGAGEGAETTRPRKSITAYNVQTVEGKVVSARPRRSRTAEARVHIEEDGIYDLLLKSPPQFYQLNIDNEFAARIFNTGSESPAPQEDWWEVQAILKLKKGNHKIEFVPLNVEPRMMPIYNKLVPRADEPDMYDIKSILVDLSLRVDQLKLVKLQTAGQKLKVLFENPSILDPGRVKFWPKATP